MKDEVVQAVFPREGLGLGIRMNNFLMMDMFNFMDL